MEPQAFSIEDRTFTPCLEPDAWSKWQNFFVMIDMIHTTKLQENCILELEKLKIRTM